MTPGISKGAVSLDKVLEWRERYQEELTNYTMQESDLLYQLYDEYFQEESCAFLNVTKCDDRYGYIYNYIRNSQLTWSQIWSNLNAKWPIAMSTFSNNSGHALTLVGCRNARGLYYITVWNSATNSYETIQYISDGKTTYMMNNAIYTWTKSLSYK